MSVRPGVDFTHHRLASSIAEMGMKYTLPDKTERKVDFLDLESCDFLKRTFVVRDGKIFAPLSETSILRSLCWIYDSSLSDEDQTIINMKTCQREMWQYGQERFEEFSIWCRATLQQIGMDFFISDLYTFSSLTADLEEAYSDTRVQAIVYSQE